MEVLMWIAVGVVTFYFIRWLLRIIFEIWLAKELVYIQVTLPRSDSKLDKEKETKKDFKEKIGIMAMVYKSLHKLDTASLKYSFIDFFFNHIKVSMEMVFKKGQLYFYVVTYEDFVDLVSQQINSVYPDAEIKKLPREDYVKLDRENKNLWTSGIRKDEDKFFPIKTYKYFEEDPLSNLSSNF